MMIMIMLIIILMMIMNTNGFISSSPSSSSSSLSSRSIRLKMLINIDVAMDKLAAANAEALARKEGSQILGKTTGGIKPLLRCKLDTMKEKPAVLGRLLEREGCISLVKVISDEMVNELRTFINEESDRIKQEVTEGKLSFAHRFGGVNCRGLTGMFGQRQDFFLPVSNPIVRKALKEVLTNIQPLLQETVTLDGRVHEVSCLIADNGAPRQNIHADTIVLPCPQYPNAFMEPMYTFFVSLQDIEDDMGHTQFLPKTHTPEIHMLWNVDQDKKEMLLKTREVVQSKLLKGDVSVFDSRILHCGMANVSNKRRILFYFTLSKSLFWPLPDGLHGSNSICLEDRYRYQVRDLLK